MSSKTNLLRAVDVDLIRGQEESYAKAHYVWLVKAYLRKPLEYASVLGVFSLYRAVTTIASAAEWW